MRFGKANQPPPRVLLDPVDEVRGMIVLAGLGGGVGYESLRERQLMRAVDHN
jgi:hypothetical protein